MISRACNGLLQLRPHIAMAIHTHNAKLRTKSTRRVVCSSQAETSDSAVGNFHCVFFEALW